MQPIIIEGHKGVMPLDLSGIEPKYHKIMIKQHDADIKEYNRYQNSLPSRLRYENTNARIMKSLNLEQHIITQQNLAKQVDQMEKDKRYHEQQTRYLQSKSVDHNHKT